MKKTLISTILAATMLFSGISGLAFTKWKSPRYIPKDEYKTPWTEEGNPYVTYYAPWLRQFHLMTKTEAQNNIANEIVGGEACQQIRALSISPQDPEIMYFCSDTSGVYKTTNGGKHWYNVTNNAAGHDGRGILCDKFDKDTVYVYMSKVGVHRSVDGGYTWEQIVEDADITRDANFRSNTIVQDDEGNTYMCVGSGIWKLERDAKEAVNLTAALPVVSLTGEDTAEFLDMAVSPNGQIIYACCAWAPSAAVEAGVETGLYISTNGGSTWEICQSASNGSTYSEIKTVAIDPSDATFDTVYVGMRITSKDSSAADEYKLYKLTNGGKTYTEVFRAANSKNEHKYFYGLKFGPKNASGIYPLYLHLDGAIYPLRISENYTSKTPSFSEVYSAKDNIGKDTTREKTSTGWNYQAFAPDMEIPGRVVFAASGVYEKSPDGKFKRISSGYSGASLTDIVFYGDNDMFAPAVDTWFYKSDGSKYTENSYPTFTKRDKGTDKPLYATRALIDPKNDDHIFVFSGISNGGTNRRIQESTDGGDTFAVETATDAVLNTANGEINATVLCYDKDDTDIIYSSYHNSYDNGKTWEENEYFILDVHPGNTKLQVGIKGWKESTVLYKTTNGGKSWEEVMELKFPNINITDADFDLNDPNYLWITRNVSGGNNAFIRVDLKGEVYEDYTDKFKNNINDIDYSAFRQVEINPKDHNHMLVTSYPGRQHDNMKNDFKLAESYDGGETWHTVPGLWGGEFNNIIFSPTTDEVFITGHAGTFIYDYKKFNYYQNMEFRYEGQSIFKELPRVNDSGEEVNNGAYVIAPEDLFKPANKRFTGWKINGTIYMPGEKVSIPD